MTLTLRQSDFTDISFIIAKYKNGTTFHWNIYGNAQELPDYARVGVCDNGYNTYNVYKDKQRVIYTIDGWQCTTIYWCFWLWGDESRQDRTAA